MATTTLADVRQGILSGGMDEIFRAWSKTVVSSARFVNTSSTIAFLTVTIRDNKNNVVDVVPPGLNLDPGDTLILVEDGERMMLWSGEALQAKTSVAGKVTYRACFESETS